MQAWTLVLDIVLLLAVALAMGILCERLKQRAIVGYLLTGAILGPSGLHLVESGEGVTMIAELGVALLLFSIGLEFSWKRLRALGAAAAGGGTLQVALTMALFAGAGVLAGLSTRQALVVGAAAALSSTAVVLRVLAARAELDSLHGRIALGILLLQDIAVIPLVLVVEALGDAAASDAGAAGVHLLAALAQAAAVVAGMIAIGRYVLPRLLHIASSYRSRDLPILLAITVFLAATWGSHALGLSPILGAFVAGLVLGETAFAEQVRADAGPLRAGFVTIFFASIGMLVEIPSGAGLVWALLLALAIVVGKTLIVALVVRLFRRPLAVALSGGLALAQIGEFSFVLAELAHRSAVLDGDVFQLLLAASLITLLATPYLVALAPKVYAILSRGAADGARVPDDADPRVIVVGFGPAGRAVVEELERTRTPFWVLELNPRTVNQYATRFPISLGDASQRVILEHAGVMRARGLVVTIPDAGHARLIVRQAKALAPALPVIVRARQHHRISELIEAGADGIVDEETFTGEALAREFSALLDSHRAAL